MTTTIDRSVERSRVVVFESAHMSMIVASLQDPSVGPRMYEKTIAFDHRQHVVQRVLVQRALEQGQSADDTAVVEDAEPGTDSRR